MTEIIMYYDSYERYNGDGFYPVLKLDPVLKLCN